MSRFWKHPQYGHVYLDEIRTPVGRLCWPYLVTPRDPPPPKPGFAPGAPRYEVTLLFPKSNPKTLAFKAEMEAMVKDGADLYNKGKSVQISIGTVVQDGDDEKFSEEKYPYYKGNYFIVARNTNQPVTVDRLGANEDPAFFKGGMQALALVTPLITAHGLSYKCSAVQFVKDDGVRFGGGVRDVKSMLKAIGEDGELTGEELEAKEEVKQEEIEELPQVVEVVATPPPAPPTVSAAKLQALAPKQAQAPVASNIPGTVVAASGAKKITAADIRANAMAQKSAKRDAINKL